MAGRQRPATPPPVQRLRLGARPPQPGRPPSTRGAGPEHCCHAPLRCGARPHSVNAPANVQGDQFPARRRSAQAAAVPARRPWRLRRCAPRRGWGRMPSSAVPNSAMPAWGGTSMPTTPDWPYVFDAGRRNGRSQGRGSAVWAGVGRATQTRQPMWGAALAKQPWVRAVPSGAGAVTGWPTAGRPAPAPRSCQAPGLCRRCWPPGHCR